MQEPGWRVKKRARAAASKFSSTAFFSRLSKEPDRQVYRADPFQIDVQVESKNGGNRIVVTGQLLNLSSPGIIGQDARIALSNMRGQVVNAVTNQFGEFSGEIENSGDLQMTFASPGCTPIVISLRDTLGSLPGGER